VFGGVVAVAVVVVALPGVRLVNGARCASGVVVRPRVGVNAVAGATDVFPSTSAPCAVITEGNTVVTTAVEELVGNAVVVATVPFDAAFVEGICDRLTITIAAATALARQ
jgi:hypothetical protein